LSRIQLSFASPAYDRNESLMTGEIQPEGIELVYMKLPPQEAHARMLKNQEFDVSDMSMSHYIIAKLAGKAPFTAIPVFPMRRFFHVDLAINKNSGIEQPQDLRGKRIGVPEYSMSFALWLRGILLHEFGVAPSDVEWHIERSPADRVGDSIGFSPPSNVTIRQFPKDKDLMQMLDSGELDAALPQFKFWKNSRDRSASGGGSELSENVGLLFQDQKAESMRYFKKTGIFPINHTVVIRNEILEKYPWIAMNLYEAFQKSKEKSYEKLEARMREPTNYIFLDDLVREIRGIFGSDPYPYGVKENEKTIDTIATYSYEQGLSPRKANPADLFFSTTIRQ
jgi:4,5-dihydroxyphthalate decarboxylase